MLTNFYIHKVLKVFAENLETKPWYKTVLYWTIDSRYRLLKRVDAFLAEQINNPHPEVLKLAKELAAKAKNQDDHIKIIEDYIRKNFIYKTDLENYGKMEYWAKAEETLAKKAEDCENLNGLLYILARLGGVSGFSIHACLGNVSTPSGPGYHFYLLYLTTQPSSRASQQEKELCGRLVRVDTTYYPTQGAITDRESFPNVYKKDRDFLNYESLDYFFNQYGAWKVDA